MKSTIKPRRLLILLSILLLFTVVLSFFVGRYSMKPEEFINALSRFLPTEQSEYNAHTVIFRLRLPRILVAIIIGGALAVSGATYQGIFGNPLVSPDLLGASAGAGLGACIAIIFNLDPILIQLFAFIGGLSATLITCCLSNLLMKGRNGIVVYILIGMVISAVFQACISISKYVADPYSDLQTITFWLMGSLSNIQFSELWILLIAVALGLIPIFMSRWKINLLSFEEEEAMAMGLNAKHLRFVLIVASTLLCSASVAIGGVIGWVGLVIPHIARIFTGPNSRYLIPISFLIGGIYLLIIDDISRALLTLEIPIGILTSAIGAPVFLILLMRGRNGWK